MICVALHICWRARLLDDYRAAFHEWQKVSQYYEDDFRVFFVDSCYEKSLAPNATHATNATNSAPHPFATPTLGRVPFLQRGKALDRFYLTDSEVAQMRAVATTLPVECTTIVKLTGKYYAPTLPPYLAALGRGETRPLLGLQQRGPSWGGYSSELFLMDRSLMQTALAARFPRTEMWVDNVRRLLLAVGMNSSILFFPRFVLARPVRRSGDRALLTWL